MKKLSIAAFLLVAAFSFVFGSGGTEGSGTYNETGSSSANRSANSSANSSANNAVTNQNNNSGTQQKYALVIGNADYTGISGLNNPVNDANDMEAALKDLGFTVDKVLNGNLEQMENAIESMTRRLGAPRNSYGFFFYAGHGVQANNENYLIPIEANNILSEAHLRLRAISLQFVLTNLSKAENELNMIVLDACRDNPFGWARSGSRGLTVLSDAPAGSIVMYATGANSVAADGDGRNGLFTGHLLNNLRTPGLSVFEVFDRTMDDVIRATDGRQYPELSLKFPGASSVYLGARPSPASAAVTPQSQPTPAVQPVPAPVIPQSQPAPAQQQVPNTNQGIANARSGDFIIRTNGQRVILTQNDIDYARRELGLSTNPGTQNRPATSDSSITNNLLANGQPNSNRKYIYIIIFVIHTIIALRIAKKKGGGWAALYFFLPPLALLAFLGGAGSR